MIYKFETDEGLTLTVELSEDSEDGYKYQNWVITVQSLTGYTVVDHGTYVLPKSVQLEILTSISKEEAE